MVHQKAIITGSWIKMVSHFHTQRECGAAFADYTFNLSSRSLTQMNRTHSFSHHIVYQTTYFQSITNPLSSIINMLISRWHGPTRHMLPGKIISHAMLRGYLFNKQYSPSRVKKKDRREPTSFGKPLVQVLSTENFSSEKHTAEAYNVQDLKTLLLPGSKFTHTHGCHSRER